MEDRTDRYWLLALLLIVGVLYGATILPGVGYSGDIAKFQFVGPALGTAHATGYPTFTLVGWAWAKLVPVGSIALRMNLLSLACMLVAVRCVFGAIRTVGVPAWAGAAGAFAFAIAPTVWQQAVAAEVYAMHGAILCGALWALLSWGRTRDARHLGVAVALVGLGFSHHMMIVSAAGAGALFIAVTDWRAIRARPVWIGAAVGVALAVLPYAYIFWRTADPDTVFLEMRASSLQELAHYLTGGQFRDQMFSRGPTALLGTSREFALWFVENFHFLLLFVLAGLAAGLRKREHALFAALFALQMVIVFNYSIVDIDAYYLPFAPVVAIYLGVGFHTAASHGRWAMPVRSRIVAATAAVLLVFSGVYAAQSSDASGKAQDRLGQTILAVTGPDSVVVTNNYHAACILHYYLVGEGLSRENRWVVLDPPPETLASWAGRRSPWETGLRREPVPFDVRLFTLGPPDALASFRGLEADVRHAGNNIYEVKIRQ
jgi:hypothetical protein